MSNIKLTQYLHRPNTTELGMGNTHETYMLINTDTNLSGVFPPSIDVTVRDLASSKLYTFKSSWGREFRVNQMGELYRDYDIKPGDEIVITKIEYESSEDINVCIRQFPRVVLIVGSNGAEVVNSERLESFLISQGSYELEIRDRGTQSTLSILFKESKKKRNDSPNETDFYSVKINGQDLANGTYYLTLGEVSTLAMLPKSEFNTVEFSDNVLSTLHANKKNTPLTKSADSLYNPFLTALRTKPFMLLAGISGTGKSRIVREMAKACWTPDDDEYWKDKENHIRNNHPKNFCMVQVKPNWHDSSELIGYVSRLNGEKFVVGPFLRFLAAALKEPNVPYFLCLDEMNLAPVEQYFAEYLSVIESRKLNPDSTITTDPIIEYENTDAYGSLIDQLFDTPEERKAYKTDEGGKRLTIPQNLFVVGTVNMDETTFSFSRKVLDRAMTIEMNEVDLHGGLEKGGGNEIGYIGNSIIGDAAEGCDIYEDNRELCDQVLAYLEQVNAILEGTPFKIAYRTRNEFLMYAVNRKKLDEKSQLWQSLDEMTSMKILSRIEGDEERTKRVLDSLKALVDVQIVSAIPPAEEGKPTTKSISDAKIEEMQKKLQATGFTSYWA